MTFEREFFYDEVRDGFYISGIIKRFWAYELTILSEIDRICKKYNIPYYADGGTLLGAVRDGQFIAWDDDIDIMMLRKDYNRFAQIAQKELPEELSFNSLEVNKDCEELAASVGKQVVGFGAELLRKYHEYPYAGSVDIFIVDELEKDSELEEHRSLVLKRILFLIEAIEKHGKSKAVLKEINEIEKILKIQVDRRIALKPQLRRVMDKIFQEFNGREGDQLAIMQFYAFLGTCKYPRSAFDKSKWNPFCGMQLPIPKDYDAVLRAEYGDYHKKVKGGGGHGYPCLKKYENKLKTLMKGAWNPYYHFSEEDLVRPKIQNFRDIAISMAETFKHSYKQFFEDCLKGDISTCISRLSRMQEEAIAFGTAIEQKKGEGTESVRVLEEYCDALYQAYNALSDLTALKEDGIEKQKQTEEICRSTDISSGLQKELEKIANTLLYYPEKLQTALKKDFKRQVVFLPHSMKYFESIRPLVDALLKAEDMECKIIPIPYYDKYGDGSPKELHYEGDAFPKEYKITDYRTYDFMSELPDCIVINSSYDEFNQVWSVAPSFYSKEMKKYTNKLIYIPWFVTDEINPNAKEDEKAFINMEYYVTVPGLFHSDLTIVQSEEMKKAYLAKIEEFAGKDVAKKMEKKIAGAGSCLLGEKEGEGIQNVVDCFRLFLEK